MIDTHAHIYLKDFKEDIVQVMVQAHTSGVDQILLPNIDVSSMDDVVGLCDSYPDRCYPMVGLHPCDVKADYQEQLDTLYQMIDKVKPIAIGEIGVDLYWDKTFAKEQDIAFRKQIDWSKEFQLPFVIHSRDSLDQTIATVADMQDGSLRGIFHCFNGTVEQGQKIIDLGFHLGIGGVVTFKNAGVDKTVAQLPLESMVLETDAPYLTPAPNRGKRNEPKYLIHVANKLAELFETSVEEVDRITTANAKTIFSL